MLDQSGLYYPNRLARAFLVAIEDVMGERALAALMGMSQMPQWVNQFPADDLARQFDFSYLATLSEAMEEMYGVRGGRGLALKVGRAAFAQGFREFGIMRGFQDSAFRVLPLAQRVEYGLRGLASLLSHFSDQQSSVLSDGDDFLFQSEVCPFAWGRSSDKPVCHAMVGIIQECLRWSTNGYEFYVREVACRAAGADACIFRIHRTAIGEGNSVAL